MAVNDGAEVAQTIANDIPETLREEDIHILPLVNLLARRGYFHKDHQRIPYAEISAGTLLTPRSIDDASILFKVVDGSFCTEEKLSSDLKKYLDRKHGSTCLKELRAELGVEPDCIVRILKDHFPAIHVLPNDTVLTPESLESMIKTFFDRISQKCLVTEMSKDLNLPVDFLESQLAGEGTPSGFEIRRQDNGYKVIVTERYLEEFSSSLVAFLSTVEEPISVKDLSSTRGWEYSWAMEILKDASLTKLPGKLHGDKFEPDIYVKKQGHAILESYNINGYITAASCTTFKVLFSQVKEIVSDADGDAIILEHLIVCPGVVMAPITASLEETIESEHWLDLQLVLNPDLNSFPEEARNLLQSYVLEGLEKVERPGFLFLSKDAALYISHGMLTKLDTLVLPPLVAPYASHTAQQVLTKVANQPSYAESVVIEVDQLRGEISAAILLANPDMAEWAREVGAPAKVALNAASTHLVDFGDFRDKCQRRLQAELRRLRSTSISQVTLSLEEAQLSFEKAGCFAAACYCVQLTSRFLLYAAKNEIEQPKLEELQEEALRGPCMDFCRRITEFSLLKHEIKGGTFTFGDENENLDVGTSPYFCSQVNTSRLEYPRISLACEANDKQLEPNSVLKEVIPGSVGVCLQMFWTLVTGRDFDAFLTYAEENCYTVSGFPFKKLDKKAEKQFFASRHVRLANELCNATDARSILDLTVALTYQRVKNQFVYGDSLKSTTLNLLCRERKVSGDIASDLRALAELVATGEVPDGNLLLRVKTFGLDEKGLKSKGKPS